MGNREEYEKGRSGSNEISKSWDEITDSIKQLEKDLAGVSSMVVQTGCLMCVCSYHQPHTKQRNYKNILIKQDQFPTLKECQKELEKVLGFEVEEVVLMNWKEVNNSYEL